MIRSSKRFFMLLPTAYCLLLLAPFSVATAQSPELVQAKARVVALNKQLDRLDGTIARELEAALAGQVDTRPKGEFETTAEHQARLATAKEAREQLAPEYERKKADRRRAIQEKIEALTRTPYVAPIRISLGPYNADAQTFPITVQGKGDKGSINIPRQNARDFKTLFGTMEQQGYWQLYSDGNARLRVVEVSSKTGTYLGDIHNSTPMRDFASRPNAVNSIAFSPNGQFIASGNAEKTIDLWRVSNGAQLRTFTGHGKGVRSVAYSPDGSIIASGTSDGSVWLWQAGNGNLLQTLAGHSAWVQALAFSPDGQILASGSGDNTIKIWQSSNGALLRTLVGHTDNVPSIAFSPDGQFLVSGSEDETINFWRVSNGTLLRSLVGPRNGVRSVAYSPDGSIIASGDEDYLIRLWRTSDGALLQTLVGHTKVIQSLAFSPDGLTLASGSRDKTIKLWSVVDGKVLETLSGHRHWVQTVSFSPDGLTLASGSLDGSIKFWKVSIINNEYFISAIRSRHVASTGGKKSSLPPAITTSISFTESSGDNVLSANEGGALEVTLSNSGKGSAYGVEVALRLALREPSTTLREPQGDVSGQVSRLSFPSSRYIGEIPPGKSRQVSIPLKAGLELPSGRATITASFTEANGFEPDPIEITFDTRAYRPPELVIADVGIDDASGNGMIEAGEVVTVMVRVRNRGRGTAEQAKAEVKVGENVFVAEGSDTQFDLGSLPPGGYKDLQFQIYTNRRAKEIAVTMTLTERYGRYGLAEAPLELPFNRPVRSIQQVVVEGKVGEVAVAGAVAVGLSIDIERDIPKGRDQRRDAVALLIANRDYMDPDIPAVTYAHRDAEFVKQYLVRTLGYREGNIFLYRDATQSNFRTALRKLKNAAKRKSDVFVYYTGHGAPDPEEKLGYFVPVDCDPNYVQLGGIGLEEFYKELGRIKARNITVVIDACFSGASAAGMLIADASPIFISMENPAASLANGVVLTSSSGEQISSWYPQMRHSLYTYYFLKALQGAADQDGDRQLTVVELQTYLEEQVPYMARRLHNRVQTPGVTPGRGEQVLVRYE